MWLLQVMPTSFIYLMTIIGVLGIILASIPIRLPYTLAKTRKVFMGTCLLFMGTGLFLQGALAEQKNWLTKVAEMETQIAQLESEAGKVTTEVIIEYVDRIKEVRVKGEVIVREVPIYITKESDEKCIVPEGFATIHDRAALNTLLDAEKKK